MNLAYILYIISFLVFPALGYFMSLHYNIGHNKKYLILAGLLFITHNILFFYRYSISGDYTDYFIFSLEYLFLCFTTFLLYKSANVFSKIFRGIGTAIVIIGFLQGMIGIIMFIVISQDFEADKIYNFSSNEKEYQTRRYSFGFVTLLDTRYTFDTYRKYDYLPIEKLINKTDLTNLKSKLDFEDKYFKVDIIEHSNQHILEMSSSNGEKFTMIIDL